MSKWLRDSWGGLITNQWYFQECWVQSKRNRMYSMGHFMVTGQWDHHHLSSDARILPSGGPHGNGWIFWHQGVLALLSCIACMWGPNLFFFFISPVFSSQREMQTYLLPPDLSDQIWWYCLPECPVLHPSSTSSILNTSWIRLHHHHLGCYQLHLKNENVSHGYC